MTISRRTFIRDAAVIGSVPALANVMAVSSIAPTHAAPVTGTLPPRTNAVGAVVDRVVFRIDGWDRYDGIAPARDTPPDVEVWIGINPSWRAAWR